LLRVAFLLKQLFLTKKHLDKKHFLIYNNLMKRKLYLDTSVISALIDDRTPERMADTLAFWAVLKQGAYNVVVSEIVLQEIDDSLNDKRDKMLMLLKQIPHEILDLTTEVNKLVKTYVELGLLAQKHKADLQHIAVATLNNCDYIASWNFKHFANTTVNAKVQGFNRVLGLKELYIFAPTMFLGGLQ